MKSNSENEERECLWCESPIEGRADKQFCSSSCKARYNRDNANASVITPSPSLPTAASYSLPLAGKDDEDDDEWENKRKERSNQEKAQKLHKMYTKPVDAFLKEEGCTLDLEWLDSFMEELDDVTYEYRQHPNLGKDGHPSRSRLDDLYLIRDYLREIREEIEIEEVEKDPDTVYLKISKKHRKRLRANLLGVK